MLSFFIYIYVYGTLRTSFYIVCFHLYSKKDMVLNVDFYLLIISCKLTAQKTIVNRRCFWASTFMTLTTEIIKWFHESKGYDSLFMQTFNIKQKCYWCLATAFVLSGLMLKEYVSQKWKFSLFNPHHAITILSCYYLYSIFLSMVYYLRLHPCLFSPSVTSLFPLLACLAFLFHWNILLCVEHLDFINRYIFHYKKIIII